MYYISKANKASNTYEITNTITHEKEVCDAATVFVRRLSVAGGIRGVNNYKCTIKDFTPKLKLEALAIKDKVLGLIRGYSYDEDWLIYPIFAEGIAEIKVPNWAESLTMFSFTDLSCIDTVELGESVKVIRDETFHGSRLTGITFNNSLTHIGYHAFFECNYLRSVDMPNSVTSIGRGAFDMCSDMFSVKLSENIGGIQEKTFANCCSLKSIILPESCKYIRKRAFENCKSLTSVIMNGSLDKLEDDAFKMCLLLDGVMQVESN